MNMLYYIPAVLGVVFIVVGTYHGWKLRTLTRHCTAAKTKRIKASIRLAMQNGRA